MVYDGNPKFFRTWIFALSLGEISGSGTDMATISGLGQVPYIFHFDAPVNPNKSVGIWLIMDA